MEVRKRPPGEREGSGWDTVGCAGLLAGSQGDAKQWPQRDCEPTFFSGRTGDNFCLGFWPRLHCGGEEKAENCLQGEEM